MPDALASFQETWKTSVSAPLRFLGAGVADTPSEDYDATLLSDILATRGVDPAARLGAYRQQYWYRLFTLLQAEFPLAGHLIGWEAFNPLADRCLRDHPPGRNLTNLGSTFPSWLRSAGAADDLVEACRVDAAWTRCFHAPDLPPPGPEHIAALAAGELDLGLQPSVQVLRLSHDWLSLRATLGGEDPPTPGPPPEDPDNWILSRQGSMMSWDRVPSELAKILDGMRRGSGWLATIEHAAHRSSRVVKNLTNWFSLGASRNWWSLREPE